VSVWCLLWALLGHAMRGRGRQPVYVVAEGLPDNVQNDLDDRDLAIVSTYAPYRRKDRFVVAVVKPDQQRE
jgi:hypothetical protein